MKVAAPRWKLSLSKAARMRSTWSTSTANLCAMSATRDLALNHASLRSRAPPSALSTGASCALRRRHQSRASRRRANLSAPPPRSLRLEPSAVGTTSKSRKRSASSSFSSREKSTAMTGGAGSPRSTPTVPTNSVCSETCEQIALPPMAASKIRAWLAVTSAWFAGTPRTATPVKTSGSVPSATQRKTFFLFAEMSFLMRTKTWSLACLFQACFSFMATSSLRPTVSFSATTPRGCADRVCEFRMLFVNCARCSSSCWLGAPRRWRISRCCGVVRSSGGSPWARRVASSSLSPAA
mmetsp:Transcript_20787/g.70450  ORF Transcript_20787/g.70450 Transcript_20787/m.70450 type:complete len:295 (-) Transcript_20787:1085-1969(-)